MYNKRILSMDIIRIVAFILLVSVHFFLNNGFYTNTVLSKSYYLAIALRDLSMSCIPLFLMLTGYLHLKKEYNKNYYRGLVKILILYILTMIFNYTIYYLAWNDDYNFKILLKHILSYEASAWINMYFGLYLLSPFLNKIYNNLKANEEKYLLITLIVLITLPSILNCWNFDSGLAFFKNPSITSTYNIIIPDWWKAFYPIMYYYIGCFFKNNENKFNFKKTFMVFIIEFILLTLFEIYRSGNGTFVSGDWNNWGGIIPLFLSTSLFVLLSKIKNIKINFFTKLISKISDLTFVAYLTTPVFEKYIYSKTSTISNFHDKFKYYIICVFLICLFSLLSSLIINFIYKLINKTNNVIKWFIILLILTLTPFIAIKVNNYIKGPSFIKYESNPIIGNTETGTLFDPFCLKGNDEFLLYVSKRNEGSIVLYKSEDGINYDDKYITILKPKDDSYIYNRATVVKKDDIYYLYFTKQYGYDKQYGYKYSDIYVVTSTDPEKFSSNPKLVYKAEENYEKYSVMNPNVIYDEDEKIFKMYYAAGELVEPDIICYATSTDGINFTRYKNNPIIEKSNDINTLDYYKVGATDVHKIGSKYYMFYIGYTDLNTARILLATSTDGINWVKDNYKAIVEPTKDGFDSDATYKPSAVYDSKNKRWLLYYNGRTNSDEYIGVSILESDKI